MAKPHPEAGTSLQVERLIAAPPEKVFAAWTVPERMTKWLGSPTPQHRTRVLEADIRVGGRYRLEITTPEGTKHLLAGSYREIRPPEKLVFTWTWEGNEGFGETLVTVQFSAVRTWTKMVLTHEMFATPEWRDRHNKGWEGCFESLAGLLKSEIS